MEYLLGPIVAIGLSLGYTEFKLRKQSKAQEEQIKGQQELIERVNTMEGNLGRNMLSAMVPMSKSIKELQTFTGMR